VPCFIVVSHQQQRGRLQGFPERERNSAEQGPRYATISCRKVPWASKELLLACATPNEAHVSPTNHGKYGMGRGRGKRG
jgi:hypothetical protein